jgi:hypothetical protein
MSAGGERAIEALERHDVAARVDHRDRAAGLVARGLGRGRGDHAPGGLQRQPLLVDHLGLGRPGGQQERHRSSQSRDVLHWLPPWFSCSCRR